MTRNDSPYTENIAEFGARERDMLRELLSHDLPEGFDNTGVKPAMNKNSGYVFLVNDDYQCAMMNGDKLEIFHSTPYQGHEGFIIDLMEEYAPDDLNREDAQYILDAATNENAELPDVWQKFADGDGA